MDTMDTTSPRLFGATGRPAIAWAVILFVALFTIASNELATSEEQPDDQTLELLLLKLQAQYLVGVARLTGDTEAVLAQVPSLNVGSVTRRQHYIALVAELGGPHEAGLATVDLDDLLAEEVRREGGGQAADENELAVQRIYRELFVDPTGEAVGESADEHAERLAVLSNDDRGLLIDELGWFAGAVLWPEGSDDLLARDEFLSPTKRVALVIMGGFGLMAAAGFAGFVILVVMTMLAYKGTIGSGLGPARGHHGVYAETFAVWIASFVLLSLVAGVITALVPGWGLIPALATFLASLFALRWPVYRGIPWDVVKQDIGLTQGERPWLEALTGLGGYLGALPLLATGMMATLVLLILQGLFAPEAGPFESAAGPAHPIVLQLAGSSFWLKLQVLLLASFAAPLVEETMFRGVLYRYLRETSRRFGTVLSVLVSGGISSLLFAAIHPQGWVAIPALMALAFSFVLVREWRGSLLPAMVMHGVSNGVVMIGLFLVLDMS